MLATLVAVTLARPSLRAGKAEFVDVSEPLELLDPELLDAEFLDVESLDAELLDAVAEWLYENHTEAIDENETEAIERKLASEDVAESGRPGRPELLLKKGRIVGGVGCPPNCRTSGKLRGSSGARGSSGEAPTL